MQEKHDPPTSDGFSGQASGDISLIDLVRLIRAKQRILYLSVLFFVLLAGLYLMFFPDKFKVEARLLPASNQDLILLNPQLLITDKILWPVTPTYAKEVFIRHFNAYKNRKAFFDQKQLARYFSGEDQPDPEAIQALFKLHFDQRLKLVAKDKKSMMQATLKLGNAEKAAELLNQYLVFVNTAAVTELCADTLTVLNATKHGMERTIEAKLKLGMTLKEDRIAVLSEAIRIAKELDIERGAVPAFAESNYGGGFAVENYNQAIALYMRGRRALQAELDVLQQRKNNEPFIPGLRQLQERLSYLNEIEVDPETIRAVTIDRLATVPDSPSNKPVVVTIAVALLLGLIVGLFAILVLHFIDSMKNY